jgi:hypothetical protein
MKRLFCLLFFLSPFAAKADWYASQSWVKNYVATNSSAATPLTTNQLNIINAAVTNPAGGNLSFQSGSYQPVSNNFTSYGYQTILNNNMKLGADAFGTLTINSLKSFTFTGFPYNNQDYLYGLNWLAYSAPATNVFTVIVGGGVSEIDFSTTPTVTPRTTINWMIDGYGNLQPKSASSAITLGSATNRVSAGYFSNLDAAVSIKTAVITNGNMILWSSTNSPPPNGNPNYIWLATSTNAPGFFFVSSNGVWTKH